MSKILYSEVPSLDLAHFTSGDARKKQTFVKDLGNAYQNIGFVAIKNHGLSDKLIDQLYSVIKDFFELPEEVKRKYDLPELAGQRGYMSKGKERAKGKKSADLKEFYHIGQTVTDNDPINEEYPENIWPKEIAGFEKAATEVYNALESAGKNMLKAIAIYLDLKEDYFDAKVHNGNSILRPIHYFPIENPENIPEDAVRAAEHGDINLITLLMGASADGLQVLRKDGKWIPITALPDQLIVNVGDMMERLTNTKLKSTIHRVVNPPRELLKTSRYSIPFFMHPRSEMKLDCLENCVNTENPKRHDDITAGDFLNQRLMEIGLKN